MTHYSFHILTLDTCLMDFESHASLTVQGICSSTRENESIMHEQHSKKPHTNHDKKHYKKEM